MKGEIIMERKNSTMHIRYMILASLFAAMIYILTAVVHIPTQQGYVHIGDGAIYLAASLLPAPYAVAAAAIGAGLSDYLSGFALWVLPTAIIKALTVLSFSPDRSRIICRRNIIGLFPAAVICVGGYYLSGSLLYGSFIASLADIPGNITQSVISSALYIFLGCALDKMGVKSTWGIFSPAAKSRKNK